MILKTKLSQDLFHLRILLGSIWLIAACKHLRPRLTALVRITSRCHGRDLAVLVDELEVVAGQEMRDGGELRTVTLSVVVEFEQRHSE